MCGIAGILKVHPPGTPPPPPEVAIPESWLDVLDESIKHRGPDGHGRFRDRATRPDGSVVDVAFVHRRLAIIDLADGQQPMVSERGPFPDRPRNGLIAVVFNGCIYNHRALRSELQAAGHRFVTDHSDTEVLIHGWREWGEEMHRHLDGMYALAIWDRSRGQVFACTDLMGEKPLYSSRLDHAPFTFASTIPALAKLQQVQGTPPQVNGRTFGMSDLLSYGFLTEDRGYGYTPLENVFRVLSKHPVRACARNGSLSIEKVFPDPARLPKVSERSPGSDDLTIESTEEMLAQAVASRLDADVSVGAFLSGGVDSSIVCLLAHRIRPDLQTFSVRMPSVGYDESGVASAVASRLGIRNEILECEAFPSDDLLRLIPQLGIPFGDSSLLPTHWLSLATKRRVKVAISGDGADELFAGYDRYRAALLLDRYGELLRMIPQLSSLESKEKGSARRFSRLVAAAKQGGYPATLMVFAPEELKSLCGMAGRKPWESNSEQDPIAEAMHFDILNYLPGDILTKVDTASMSAALETRAPFLAREVVQLSMRTPVSVLMRNHQRKGLLRAIARKYLPTSIVDRPKMGFSIPIGDWFRTDYGSMKQLLLDTLNSTDPFPEDLLGIKINRQFVAKMVADHMDRKRDHSQRLYMLLVLAIWANWLRSVSRGAA